VDAPQNTPVIAVVNGQRLVIFAAGDGGIHAFQPRSGKKAWMFKASKRGINTSVVVEGDRLYCSHGLDNLDDHKLGRIFCIDIANLEKGSPKELWSIKGIEAGFPTPVVAGKYLYVVDDRANLHQIDKTTGRPTWTRGQQMYGWDCGSVGKASPVYGDGKLYVVDGDGTFSIVKPAEKRSDVKATKVKLTEKLGREYVVYGSPAIVDGRMYVQAATKLYCVGNKDQKPEHVQIPPLPEEKAPEQGKPALVQVIPADVSLHAGQGVKFTARTFDASGRLLGEAPADQVKWSIAQLTIPAPPPRPRMPQPENAPRPGDPAGGAPAAGAPAAAGDGAAAEEESATVDVVLNDGGDKKIQVIKVVRAATGLGLKEAKALVDEAPKPVKEGIDREEGEKLKSDLEEAGGSVELK
jgi:ribosomal protein L7/L12